MPSRSETRFRRVPLMLFRINLAVDALLLFAAIAIIVAPRAATFVADIDTAVVNIDYRPGDTAPDFGESEITLIDFDQQTRCEGGLISLPDPLDRQLGLKVSAQDGLKIYLSTSDPRGLGLRGCGSNAGPSHVSEAIVDWPTGQARSKVLAIEGRITAGALPQKGDLTPSLLESGRLQMETSASPFGDGRASSEVLLHLGDELQILDSAGQPAKAYGLLRWDNGRLKLMLRAKGHRAMINAIGQERAGAVAVAPSFWTKLQAQSEWAVIIFCVAILLNMISATQALWGLLRDERA